MHLPPFHHSKIISSPLENNPKMTQILDNQAAWLPEEKARALEVGPGPRPSPEENEVVIKVAYAAVNPTDWKV